MNREHLTPFSALPDGRPRELNALASPGSSWAIAPNALRERPQEMPFVFTRSSLLLMVLWLFIGTVAAYDVYLSVKYQDTLRFQELNPVGQWLLKIDNGSVAVFMGCKFLGTMITLGVVIVLYCYKRHLGLTVASALACAQAMVAGYLLFG
jgi:hypothetical protein